MNYKSFPYFLITLLCCATVTIHAQHDNVWAFGQYAGIDFNTSPPTTFKSKMETMEGVASICDENGMLQFYTDGYNIYDRQHNRMHPLGINEGLVDYRFLNGYGTASTSQGAIIIPMPGDSSKYYVFSLLSRECGADLGRLSYSIVDMSGNNGMGSVISRENLLDSFLTEHMSAVSGNDCNVWLIVVSRKNNSFKAFNIDVNGIALTPVSSAGSESKELNFFYEFSGNIDISPDRKKLAITQEKVVLYDFDIVSGKVSSPVVLDIFPPGLLPPLLSNFLSTFYGVSFSPDNSKLYATLSEVSTNPRQGLYQFDLSSGDSLTMVNTKTLLSAESFYALRRGPDGKIYCALLRDSYGPTVGTNTLSVIHQPNLPGMACQLEDAKFILFPTTFSRVGLPNTGTIFTHRRFSYVTTDSSYCSNRRTLTARNLQGLDYIWEDSTTGPTRMTDSPGVYWVRYKVPINSPCKYDIHVDTFHVVFALTTRDSTTIIRDSGMCKADIVRMEAGSLWASNYLWDDGNTGAHREVQHPGNYWVTYRVDSLCTYYRDDFIVFYPEQDYRVGFAADSLVCTNDPVSFLNTSDRHYVDFTWSFGDGYFASAKDTIYTYLFAGSYKAMLTGSINERCLDSAYQTIIVDAPLEGLKFIADRDEICLGESVQYYTDIADSALVSLHWQLDDGYTFTGIDAAVSHTYDHTGVIPVILTANSRVCPDVRFADTIKVHALPLVDLGPDSTVCLGGSAIILQNRHSLNEDYNYRWSTGSDAYQLAVIHPGLYSLTVSDPLGCSGTEWITVLKDCYIDIPNAFSPNGDGINDYFFPRQMLSKSVIRFRMEIYNRWGQLLYRTSNPEGCGWDGRFNGIDQPGGVYIYRIEIVLENDRQEQYEGNVTLLR